MQMPSVRLDGSEEPQYGLDRFMACISIVEAKSWVTLRLTIAGAAMRDLFGAAGGGRQRAPASPAQRGRPPPPMCTSQC